MSQSNTKGVSSGTQTPICLSPSQFQRPRCYEKFKHAKLIAERAMRENHIFTIVGRYPLIRAALRKRGWVEKTYSGDSPRPRRRRRRQSQTKSFVDIYEPKPTAGPPQGDTGSDSSDDDDAKANDGLSPTPDIIDAEPSDYYNLDNEDISSMMSRMVRRASPNFIWTCRRDCIYFKRIKKNQLVNHFPSADFTTKVGLCNCLQDVRWYAEVDVRSFFPRCYCIGVEEEKFAFIEDFRLTACLGILKWVVNFVQSTKITNFTLPVNCLHVPIRVGEVALQQCEAFLRTKTHEDIDMDVTVPMTDDQWSVVLDWYYQLVHKNALMIHSETISDRCVKMLKKMRPHWPQMELDGMNNVWIVKPGAKSRGIGITLHERLENITNLVDTQVVVKSSKYVVQKYIERPFLIYNTKFDIRQWFMVTDWNPLTIYFYKDCYLRFCSRYFSLDDKSEAVHLCNNAVQRRYMHEDRPTVLPKYAMWSIEEFKEFLKKKGKSTVWDKVIYPGMKDAVIATMGAAQDYQDAKKGCFELYGADFMLAENFRPWLLEINSSPCLAPTTQVTARLCANVLEDTIKVLVDRRLDRNASMGRFELAYRQSPLVMPPYIGINLYIQGTAIVKPPHSRLNDGYPQEMTDKRSGKFERSKCHVGSRLGLITRHDGYLESRRVQSALTNACSPSNHRGHHRNSGEQYSVDFLNCSRERPESVRPSSHSSLHIEQLYSEDGIAEMKLKRPNSTRLKRVFSGRVLARDDRSQTSDMYSSSHSTIVCHNNTDEYNVEGSQTYDRNAFRTTKLFSTQTTKQREQQQASQREELPMLSLITLSPWRSPSNAIVPSNWHPYSWYQLPSTLQIYLHELDKKRGNMVQPKVQMSPYADEVETTTTTTTKTKAKTKTKTKPMQDSISAGPHIVPITY